MSIRRTINYTGFDGNWTLNINWDNTIEVWFDSNKIDTTQKSRVYNLLDGIKSIEHDTEYVTITYKDGGFIQFKFEIDGAFIGDMYYPNGDFADSCACYSFYDD